MHDTLLRLLSVGNTTKADRACALPSLAHQRVFAVRVCPVGVREVVARRGDRRRQRRAAGPNQILQQMLSSRADAHGQTENVRMLLTQSASYRAPISDENGMKLLPPLRTAARVCLSSKTAVYLAGQDQSAMTSVWSHLVKRGEAHCHTLPTRLCTPNGDAPLGWASLSSGSGQPWLVLAQ